MVAPSNLDWAVVGVSLAMVVIAGLAKHRRASDSTTEQFVVAGRALTTPLFVATMVATWYGAVLGTTEFVYMYGLMMIVCFALPYYVAAIAYAYFLPTFWNGASVSLPDAIARRYGNHVRPIVAVIVLCCSVPIGYQLSLGVFLQSVTDWPLWCSVVLGSAISVGVVWRGGLRSDVYANVVQTTLMYGGFACLALACVVNSPDSLSQVVHRVPAQTLTIGSLLAWWCLALQTFVDPTIHVRVVAMGNITAAQRGLVLSVIGWIVFDLLQLIAALYAVNAFGGSAASAYMFASFAWLPDGLRGVFYAAVLAAIMSTLTGYLLSGATVLSHDILGRGESTANSSNSYRIAMIILASIGVVVALLIPSVLDLLLLSASIPIASLIVPLLTIRGNHSFSPMFVALWLCLPAVSTIAGLLLQHGFAMEFFTIVPPLLIGIGISLAMYVVRRNTKNHSPLHP
jgi:solute:Na+ symporter, SSS family